MFAKLRSDLAAFDPRQRSVDFRRGLRNAAYNSAAYVLLPLLWLVATPMFVARLGIDQYGIWMVVNTLLGLAGVMSFGMSDATIKFVSQYRAQDDVAGVARVIRFSLAMYGSLGLLAAGLVFITAPWVVHHVLNVERQHHTLAIAAIQISGLGLALSFIDNVFQATLHGFERYDLAAKVTMVIYVATFCVQLVLVLSGYGLVAVLIGTIVLFFPSIAAKALLVKRALVPGLLPTPLFERAMFRQMLAFGIYSWLQGLGGILLGQIDRLLIASLLNTSVLTYYVVCLNVAQQIHVVLARAVSFVFPLASALNESGDVGRLRRVYFKGSNFTTVAAVALGVPLFVFADEILALWMGIAFAEQSAHILRVLVLVFVALATTIVPYYYLNGTGLVRLNTLFGLVSGGAVTLSAWLLIPPLALAGAAWARMVNIPIALVSRSILHYRILLDQRWYSGLLVILPVLIPFAIGYTAIQIFSARPASLFGLAIAGLGCSIAGAALAWGICAYLDRRFPLT